MRVAVQTRKRKPARSRVRLWELLNLETQMMLIQRDLVDRERIGVDRGPAMPRLVLFESREQLERIMREKPGYCIFQPSLRGLRSPKVSFQDPVGRNDRAHNRKR